AVAAKLPPAPNSSALASTPLTPVPPLRSMRPSASKTDAAPARDSVMVLTGSHVPLETGSALALRSPIAEATMRPRVEVVSHTPGRLLFRISLCLPILERARAGELRCRGGASRLIRLLSSGRRPDPQESGQSAK